MTDQTANATTQAQRRDRYIAAMDAVTSGRPTDLLDAVMAVADAEQAELRALLARIREWSDGPCPTRPRGHEIAGDRALGYVRAMDEIAQLLVGGGPLAADHGTQPPAAAPAVDRAAVLADVERAIRNAAGNCGYKADDGCDFCNGVTAALDQLCRLADETPDAEAARDCPACDAGIGHSEHCPTPETHKWGCGCHTKPATGARQDGATP